MKSEILPSPTKSLSLFALPSTVVLGSILSVPFVDNIYPMAALFFSIYLLIRRTFEAILVNHQLTSEGIKEVRGLFLQQERIISYPDIDSVISKQSKLQKLFDSGNLQINSAGTLPMLIKHTDNHIALKHALEGLNKRHKELLASVAPPSVKQPLRDHGTKA